MHAPCTRPPHLRQMRAPRRAQVPSSPGRRPGGPRTRPPAAGPARAAHTPWPAAAASAPAAGRGERRRGLRRGAGGRRRMEGVLAAALLEAGSRCTVQNTVERFNRTSATAGHHHEAWQAPSRCTAAGGTAGGAALPQPPRLPPRQRCRRCLAMHARRWCDSGCCPGCWCAAGRHCVQSVVGSEGAAAALLLSRWNVRGGDQLRGEGRNRRAASHVLHGKWAAGHLG